MIQIKAYFGNWREVDRETARNFVLNLMERMPSRLGKIDLINQKHVRGITAQELLTQEEISKYQGGNVKC